MTRRQPVGSWREEVDRLAGELGATFSRAEKRETWEDELGGHNVRGGVCPESQYAYGPIVVGYEEVEIEIPDHQRRDQAAAGLYRIFKTHSEHAVRKHAAALLRYGRLSQAINELWTRD